MRTSPVHYIAPSSISITPNANGSANDLAVYVARSARIKVYSRGSLQTQDATYQQWKLSGRNRRLAESDVPYTIYARLQKKNKGKNGIHNLGQKIIILMSKMGHFIDGILTKWYIKTAIHL